MITSIDLTPPPLGLKPRLLHDMGRANDIAAAIIRYSEAGKEVPIEWYTEYFELKNREELNREEFRKSLE